jgi:hypothetical protein
MADTVNQSHARQQVGSITNVGTEVCRCLMSKAKLLNLAYDPTVPASNDRSYWCVHTQSVIGSDGAVAEPESCKLGRSCYDHNS